MAGQTLLPSQQLPQSSGAIGSSSTVRTVLSQAADSAKMAFGQQRPWAELLGRNSFGKPVSLADASTRIKKNLSYFRMNYAFFLLVVLVVGLLWHLLTLILLLVLLAIWMVLFFPRTEPVVVFNRSISNGGILAIFCVVAIVVVFLTHAGSTFFSALAIGAAVIGIHAAFRVPDDLFLDEQENSSVSFLNNTGVQPTRISGI
eukprot:c21057_g1_i1 orf=298-903(+)